MNTNPTNEERAERIPVVLDAYAAKATLNPPDENTIRDLLTDLMHYCNQEKIHFEREYREAQENYEAEIDALRPAKVEAWLNALTQAEAQAWLVRYDSEAADYWSGLPDGTDFVDAVRDNIRDFGYEGVPV